MRSSRTHLWWFVVAAILVVLPPRAAAAAEDGSPIAIVVNRSNPVESLTLNQVRELLRGGVSTWPNGRRVVLVLSDDRAIKEIGRAHV